MAQRNLSLLLLLILFTIANATNLRHVSPSSAPTSNPSALCSSAQYPAICQYLIATYHPQTPEELRDASMEDTIKKAGIAKLKADRMSRDEKDEIVARRIHSCATAFDDVATTLTDAQNYLKGGEMSLAADYTYAATSLCDLCLAVFDYEQRGVDYPTKKLYKSIMKLSMNTITLFHPLHHA